MKSGKAVWMLLACTAGFLLFTLGFFVGRNSGSTIIYQQEAASDAVGTAVAAPEKETQNLPDAATSNPTAPDETESTQSQLQTVNINTADIQQLQQLSGIGPKLAQRIVDYRQSYGAFKTIDQIKDVPGIGDGIFQKIQACITVG